MKRATAVNVREYIHKRVPTSIRASNAAMELTTNADRKDRNSTATALVTR